MHRANIAVAAGALVGLFALPVGVYAEQQPEILTSPPTIGIVVASDGHTLEVRRVVQRMVTRTTTQPSPPGVTIKMNTGSVATPPTTETVPVFEEQVSRIDVATVTAARVDGRTVSAKALLDELTKPTPVILLDPHQQISALYAKLFKPDSIILSLPVPTAPSTFDPIPRKPTTTIPQKN